MHNTGNELESNDILDFSDNCENLDVLMNADQEYWTDRLGNKRPTIDYALRMAGFTPAGFDFTTGGILGNGDRNKCVFNQADQTWYSWSGNLPYNVIAGSAPGEGWKVVNRNALTIAREALRRTYQEVGLNLVSGSFEQGAVITSTTDVVLHEKTGKCYSGHIGNVPKGTDPLSGGFVDKSPAVITRRIDIRDFGATIGADARSAILLGIQRAKEIKAELYAEGEYLLSDTITMRDVAIDFSNAKFVVPGGTIGFIIGGNSSGTTAPTQKLGDVVSEEGNTVVPALPTIRIAGTKGQNIEIKSTNYLQLYADNNLADADGSIGYNNINIGVIYKLELTNNTTFPDGTVQWINENYINVSRLRGNLIISGTYHHNHNRFNGLVLENGRTIDIQKGSSNYFDFIRFEGAAPTINFGKGTWNNFIMQTWASNPRAGYESPSGVITDLGIGNTVFRKSLLQLLPRPIATINHQKCKTFQQTSGGQTSITGVQTTVGGLFDFRISANNASMIETGLLEVEYGEALKFYSNRNLFRVRFFAYDANKRQIQLMSDSNHLLCNAGTSVATSGYLTQPSNTAESLAIVVSPLVKYVRVVVLSGPSTLGSYFDNVTLEILSPMGNRSRLSTRELSTQTPGTSAKPTAGFAAIGQLVKSTTSEGHYRCTFSLLAATTELINTTLLPVDQSTGVEIGDVVGVQLDDGTCHWSTVATINPLTITSAPPLGASIGNLVGFNRWA